MGAGARRGATAAALLLGGVLVPPPASGSREEGGPRIALRDRWAAAALRQAVRGARRRLGRERCQGLLSQYADERGTPLRARLDPLGLTPAEYLELIHFRDGGGLRQCRQDHVLALTPPGSRVVWICGRRFAEQRRRDLDYAEFTVIHETLHSLGLGENPPRSTEITGRVVSLCS